MSNIISSGFQLGVRFSFLGMDCTGTVEGRDSMGIVQALARDIDLRDILNHYGIDLPKELKTINLDVKTLYFYFDTKGEIRFTCTVEPQNKTLAGDLGEIFQPDSLQLKFHITIQDGKPSFVLIKLFGTTDNELQSGICCERFDLLFKYKRGDDEDEIAENWILAGSISGRFFDLPPVELSASYEKKEGGKQIFRLAISFASERKTVSENEFEKIEGVKRQDSKEIWLHLRKKGYLNKEYLLTDEFKPFEKDFTLNLKKKFSQYENDIIDCLLPSKPLLQIIDVADITIRKLSLTYEKIAEDTSNWSFSAITDLNIYSLLDEGKTLFQLRHGELTLFDNDKGEKGFQFTAYEAELNLNLFNYSQEGKPKTLAVAAGLESFKITKKEDGWDMACGAYLGFKDTPSPLDKVFAGKIKGSCAINSKQGVTLMINRLAKPVKLDFTYMKAMGIPFDLGDGIVDVRDIEIIIGKEISLSGNLAIGLPSRLNNVLFGEDDNKKAKLDFFKTYYKPLSENEEESAKEKKSLLLLNLRIGEKDGIKGTLFSSPIQAIEVKDKNGSDKKWIFIDLCSKECFDDNHQIKKEYIGTDNDFGRLSIQMPEFAFNPESGSFKASGGYEIDQGRGIKIPLLPIKKLIEMLRLDVLANAIPSGIPVKTVKLINTDENGNRTLNLDEFKNVFKSVGLEIPGVFLNVINEFEENILDPLPDRFIDYLKQINVPQSLDFNIDITGDGGVTFGLSVAGDPLQFLIPCGASGQIIGIRLNKLAFGTVLGGALLKVEIDGDLDSFDLITLAASILMNLTDSFDQKIKDLLPDGHRFQTSFIMRDFLLLVILATEIPIPIPLFYKRLEMAYVGITGFELKTRISLPKPEFKITEIFNIIKDAKDFLVKELPAGKEKTAAEIREWVAKGILLKDFQYGEKLSRRVASIECDTALSVGPLYLMLPRYVGIEPQDVYEFDNSEIKDLEDILENYIKENNEDFKNGGEREIKEKLINTRMLRKQQYLTEDYFRKSVRQSIEADLEIFGIKIKDVSIREKIEEPKFKNILAEIIVDENKETLQEAYDLDLTEGSYVLKEHAEKNEIKKIVKYYQLEEDLEISPFDSLVDLKKISPEKPEKLGNFIGLKGNVTLPSIREIINTSLNSIKLLSINYFIESLHIDDRVGSVSLTLFYIFELNVIWMLTTPKEFSEKAHDALNRKYKELSLDPKYPVIKKESPADELLRLLADNDLGQEITDDAEGICIFLKGGLDIGNGAIVLETAIGLVAGGVRGFRTGVSFRGYVVDIVDIKLLGFVKIAPKSKTEPFKLLGEGSFEVFDRQVVAGLFELTKDKLVINGMLDLFPKEFPIVLKGHIIAYISKEEFLLDSAVNFEIGMLRALASIYIHANKNENVLKLDLLFINSELHFLLLGKTDHTTEATLDVDLHISALKLIDLDGTFNITVNAASGFAMQGRAQLLVGSSENPLVRGDAQLEAQFDPTKGNFGVLSSVSLSFGFLSSAIRLTGGFAFFTWFSGEHEGDFLLSLGGYHPLFKPPAHYPAVTRIGLNWQVNRYMNIKGNAYFTLTASCIMAGGRLEATWQSGGKKASFVADANFIMAWKPFQYSAELSVCMRLSYTFKFIVTRTLSCELGASLALWGPELSGKATVHIWKISFPIRFGKATYQKPAAIKWDEFRKEFLPGETEGSDAGLGRIVAESGILKDFGKDPDVDIDWLISPSDFKLSVMSAIPVKEACLGTVPQSYTSPSLGIAPMGLTDLQFQSKKTITISRDAKDVSSEFQVKPLCQNSPTALWGESLKPQLNGSPLIKNSVIGFEVVAKDEDESGSTALIPLAVLQNGGECVDSAFDWQQDPIKAEPAELAEPAAGVSSLLKDADKRRLQLIGSFGFTDDDVSFDNLCRSRDAVFICSPQLWEIKK